MDMQLNTHKQFIYKPTIHMKADINIETYIQQTVNTDTCERTCNAHTQTHSYVKLNNI